jgi:hypothetical protein
MLLDRATGVFTAVPNPSCSHWLLKTAENLQAAGLRVIASSEQPTALREGELIASSTSQI